MSTFPSETPLDPVTPAGTPHLAARCAAAILQIEWRALVPLIGTVAAIHVVVAAILRYHGLPVGYLPAGLADMLVMFLAGVVIASGYVIGPQLGSDMIRQARGRTPTPFHQRLSNAAALLVSGWALALVFAAASLANSNLKPAIPVLNPTTYDIQLETVERTLFGGVLPSEWLAAHSGPAAFWFWDAVYAMFGMFLFVSMMIALHRGGMRGGARLILALSLGLFATLAVSLAWPTRGPAFVHPEWFTGLSELESGRLAQFLSFSVQQYADQPQVRHAVAGISAMPSFHVLSWTCGALCWRGLPRPLVVLACLLVLTNWMSTVVLGWHYVLDGLAGVLLALAVYWVAGAVLQDTKTDLAAS